MNRIEHAFVPGLLGHKAVDLRVEPHGVVLTFEDECVAFDPLQAPLDFCAKLATRIVAAGAGRGTGSRADAQGCARVPLRAPWRAQLLHGRAGQGVKQWQVGLVASYQGRPPGFAGEAVTV